MVDKYLYKYNKNKELSLFIYFVIAILYLTITIIVLLLSKRPYLIYLIIDIVLSILFGFYSVYYFSIILKIKKETVLFLKKLDNGNLNKEYAIFNRKLDDEIIGNLPIYVYMFHTLDGKERKLRCIDNICFGDKKYYIETKLDYIVSFKVYEHE